MSTFQRLPTRPASVGRRRLGVLLIGSLVLMGLLGCVERRLIITSDPPGALVFLNEQDAGRTPLEVPFTWYGVYDVRLEREGYTTLHTQREAVAPWWENPGPDLFAEAIPNKRVEIAWHLQMQEAVPASEVDPLQSLENARQLRELNRRD